MRNAPPLSPSLGDSVGMTWSEIVPTLSPKAGEKDGAPMSEKPAQAEGVGHPPLTLGRQPQGEHCSNHRPEFVVRPDEGQYSENREGTRMEQPPSFLHELQHTNRRHEICHAGLLV